MPVAKRSFASVLIAGAVMLGVLVVPLRAQAQELIGCDTVRNLGNAWQNVQTGRNIGVVACYVVPGVPPDQSLLIELRVTSGAFDLFIIPGAATIDTPANGLALNSQPITANMGWQPWLYPAVANTPYTVAVGPSVAGARGSYQLRMRATPGPQASPVFPTPIPLPVPVPGAIILPTTTDRPCSTAGVNLSDLCVDPYPVGIGGTAYAVWRIANFQSGAFDKGDGRGFIGPIAAQQRVDVPNVTVPRVIRLQWTDLQGRTYVDSLLVPVSGQPPLPPVVDTFPCSRAGMGISNLCILQPYPVKRGSTAYAVWRITSFRSGEFDKGDGQGFRGPITAEQQVDIPNVTAPRLVQLRWVDTAGNTHTDSLIIQVVD